MGAASLIDQETRERIIRLEEQTKRQNRLLESIHPPKSPPDQQPVILEKLNSLDERLGRLETREPPPPVAVEIPDLSPQLAGLNRHLWMLLGLAGSSLILALVAVAVRLSQRAEPPKIEALEAKEEPRHAVPRQKKATARRESARPQLEVAPDQDKIRVSNVGRGVADEIRLLLGPAPATLTERQRVVGALKNGEAAVLEMNHWGAERLYGKLEYKNPATGRAYKNSFVLGYNPEAGRFFAEAS